MSNSSKNRFKIILNTFTYKDAFNIIKCLTNNTRIRHKDFLEKGINIQALHRVLKQLEIIHFINKETITSGPNRGSYYYISNEKNRNVAKIILQLKDTYLKE